MRDRLLPRSAQIIARTLTAAGLVACSVGGVPAAPNRVDTPAPTSPTPRSASPSVWVETARARPSNQRLFVEVRWVAWDTRRRSLVVVPTDVLRRNPTVEWAEAGWAQVVSAVPAADSPGMREQYVCHVLFAPQDDSYYLEPWRPAMPLARTVIEGCNPGADKHLG